MLFAQEVITIIPLNTSLERVDEITQFSDDRGNVLLKFRDKDICQYNLIQQEEITASKTIELNNTSNFLECLYNENEFSLFYGDKKKENINVLRIGQDSPTTFLKTNIKRSEEKYLSSFYSQGDFLIFKYSESPFTIHTYRYEDGQYFEKESQVFHNSKRERLFLGLIRTEKDLVVVRLSMNNPFAFHFYRYIKNKGFEKKSIDIRSIYKKAGFKTKVFPSDLNSDASRELSASIQVDNIYIDMENLVDINPSFSRDLNLRQYPGILRFDWEGEDSEILSFDQDNHTDFANRSVTLLDDLYFKLLVNKNYFDLSIFDVTNQKLLKKYKYNKDQKIDLAYEHARMRKRTTINFDLFSTAYLPLGIDHPKEKIIDTKELLKTLSAEDLFLDAYKDENVIELRATGINQKTIFLDQTFTASFTGYLSQSDLSIIKNLSDLDDPKWTSVEKYITNLATSNKNLGETVVYTNQDKIYLAFIDQKERHCKVIAF